MKHEKNIIGMLWGISLIPMILTIILYNRLPENIPMHWNVYGQIDSFSPKFPGAFYIPVFELLMTALFIYLPRLDPKKENYIKFRKSYTAFMFLMVIFFTALQIVIFGVSMGADFIKVDTIVKLFVGILILVIGNILPKLKHNYFMGIKTPWTLSSEDVWFKVHRHGGVVWFVTGILLSVLAFIPGVISAGIYFGLIMMAALEPTIYSYICYRKEVRR